MVEHLGLELGPRPVHSGNMSLRVVGVDVRLRFLAGRGAIAETQFSRSESAKSCLMISPFSRFSALLGSPARVFANMANTARAVTTPMNRMLTIYAVFFECVVEQWFKTGLCTCWSCGT
jgi:hypothetical protein